MLLLDSQGEEFLKYTQNQESQAAVQLKNLRIRDKHLLGFQNRNQKLQSADRSSSFSLVK